MENGNTEILEAIQTLSTHMDEKFIKIETKLGEHDERFNKIESRLATVESQMVTKSYLDEKLADLRGDLVVMTRKEDTKLRELVNLLSSKNVITPEEVKRILQLEPFPIVQ